MDTFTYYLDASPGRAYVRKFTATSYTTFSHASRYHQELKLVPEPKAVSHLSYVGRGFEQQNEYKVVIANRYYNSFSLSNPGPKGTLHYTLSRVLGKLGLMHERKVPLQISL